MHGCGIWKQGGDIRKQGGSFCPFIDFIWFGRFRSVFVDFVWYIGNIACFIVISFDFWKSPPNLDWFFYQFYRFLRFSVTPVGTGFRPHNDISILGRTCHLVCIFSHSASLGWLPGPHLICARSPLWRFWTYCMFSKWKHWCCPRERGGELEFLFWLQALCPITSCFPDHQGRQWRSYSLHHFGSPVVQVSLVLQALQWRSWHNLHVGVRCTGA
jgi:hypothetical protein